MAAKLSQNEMTSVKELVREVYSYSCDSITPANGNWLTRLFSQRKKFDLSHFCAGATLFYEKRSLFNELNLIIEHDGIWVDFDASWNISYSLKVLVDGEYINVSAEDGPWHDRVREMIKQFRAGYCKEINVPARHATKRDHDIERAKEAFAPKTIRHSNPLATK